MDTNKELLEKIKGEVSETLEGFKKETNEKSAKQIVELETAVKSMAKVEDVEAVKGQLEEIGLSLKAMKEGAKAAPKSLKEKLAGNLDAIKGAEDGKAPFVMTFKANSIGTISTIDYTNHVEGLDHFYNPQYSTEILKPRRNEFNILEYVDLGQALSRIIYWVEQINEEGQAEFINECELKPLVDWDYEAKSAEAKKVAVRAKLCTEILSDIPQLEAEVRAHLARLVREAITQQILAGDGTGANLNGIQGQASAFVAGGFASSTVNPNNYDVITAVRHALGCVFCTPDIIFMNCVDLYQLKTTKNADGSYIFPRFASEDGFVIDGIRVIESQYIPEGSFLMGDFSKLHVRMLEDVRVEIGWENDDFSRNLRTFIAEARLMSYVADIDKSCFIFDTFANVKTLITA